MSGNTVVFKFLGSPCYRTKPEAERRAKFVTPAGRDGPELTAERQSGTQKTVHSLKYFGFEGLRFILSQWTIWLTRNSHIQQSIQEPPKSTEIRYNHLKCPLGIRPESENFIFSL